MILIFISFRFLHVYVVDKEYVDIVAECALIVKIGMAKSRESWCDVARSDPVACAS